MSTREVSSGAVPSLGPGTPGRYPPIGDYAFLGDCHTGALVSSAGSVDWLCLPRLDSGSYFGRLLDRERGGWCAMTPADPAVRTSRRYLDGTLVLETEMAVAGGRVRVTDCLTMRPGGARRPYRQLLRVVDGLEGAVDLRVEVVPRFDYGQVRPWIRRAGHTWQGLGGDDGLVVEGDVPLVRSGLHDLVAEIRVAAGQRLRLSLRHVRPEVLEGSRSRPPSAGRARPAAGTDGGLVARVVGPRRSARQRPSGADPLGHGAQGAHPGNHRGNRRRGHHLLARGPRRAPQLGLPCQLGAGLGVRAAVAGRAWPHRRGRRVPAIRPAQRRRQRPGAPDHVRAGG